MATKNNKKMRHMSFVLPPNEHSMFRFMCYCFHVTPSALLRKMVAEKLKEWDKQEIAERLRK